MNIARTTEADVQRACLATPRMSTAQFQASQAKSKRRNKYGVSAKEDRTWRCRVFASKAEMLYVQTMTMTAREVIPQPLVWLAGEWYRPDALVISRNGATYYADVKGKPDARWNTIKRLWRVNSRLPLHVLKYDYRGKVFDTTEIISAADGV